MASPPTLPKKTPRRTHHINLRLTPHEGQTPDQLASQQEVPVAALARHLVLQMVAYFAKQVAMAKTCLSITGNCYYNAPTESFFTTVRLEAIPAGIFASRQQARMDFFDYIEVFYNRQRLHSAINYARPVSHAA